MYGLAHHFYQSGIDKFCFKFKNCTFFCSRRAFYLNCPWTVWVDMLNRNRVQRAGSDVSARWRNLYRDLTNALYNKRLRLLQYHSFVTLSNRNQPGTDPVCRTWQSKSFGRLSAVENFVTSLTSNMQIVGRHPCYSASLDQAPVPLSKPQKLYWWWCWCASLIHPDLCGVCWLSAYLSKLHKQKLKLFQARHSSCQAASFTQQGEALVVLHQTTGRRLSSQPFWLV